MKLYVGKKKNMEPFFNDLTFTQSDRRSDILIYSDCIRNIRNMKLSSKWQLYTTRTSALKICGEFAGSWVAPVVVRLLHSVKWPPHLQPPKRKLT